MRTTPIRVLVVDDSALMRKMITQMLQKDPAIEVIGTAMDGAFGLKKIEELRPDVVTLDLEMPNMDGMEMLRHITKRGQTPVIVVSAHTTQGARETFKALQLGAFDFVAKPQEGSSLTLENVADEIIAKIKVAGAARKPRPQIATVDEALLRSARKPARPPVASRTTPSKIIAIGISTGGPNALLFMLSQLPADFAGTILIVQHMPEGFTQMFSNRLAESCAIEVKEAASGDLLLAGRALICPGNRHMRVRRMPMGDVVVLSDEPPVNGHRPSADVLFRSVAQEFGPKVVALIMTGMGEDGADAIGAVKAAGGLAVAQDEGSSVVFGMPKVAIERGNVNRVVALDALPNLLMVQSAAQRVSSFD
ncbi:response regulator receiver modulated CheB methylesterase [Candidatus Koribacter versatilis Ellin345]|uniref:Protein-glutamate methylesterase/protein-glutamine glutaminase 2 n=1 Tax=Koribacter versatilis (strain Ellin345) TaxID=204669 RepID=CHEB2_KORVE|nr:chemotaxis response regulator protein-glutamate methylesterase [Candidatus Koribacter versatilis]Q1IQS9.1 RecName: Full=Protein-glutamate methylesterase/protein-glutamine glutaminase 2 [Candidatus Koribacter versatilis Ellin345]ABF40771.1 response regulator receiver modulated CheB methylesterase [Candidatus Koribacter versatilis Ellin345]